MRARLLIIFCSAGSLGLPVCFAQPVPNEPLPARRSTSDSLALHHLLGESPLASNALEICRQAARRPPAERFDLLADWVLPSRQHSTFRLQGDFFSSSPPPLPGLDTVSSLPVADRSALQQYLANKETLALPALDLIEAAAAAGRLEELRKRILAVSPDNFDQFRSRATLLFTVDVARRDQIAAASAFQRMVRALRGNDRDDLFTLWRDLLVMWVALPDPAARRMVQTDFFTHPERMTQPAPDPRIDVLMDYLRATQGLFELLESETENSSVRIDQFEAASNWLPYSLSSAAGRGQGRPGAVWSINGDGARKYVGHETDYFSYRLPLRGNFEVECEISTGFSATASLMVAGTHVEYLPETHFITSGNFRRRAEDRLLTPQLTQFESTVHHRAVVRNRLLTHYINGRPVLEKRLSPDHDPWVAIRCERRSQARVSHVRITGQPAIPEEIRLVGDPEADGWIPYFEERFGIDEGTWGVVREPTGGYGILGRSHEEFAGAGIPQLLRYHRPLVEDGTVEYEFFYRAGKSCVHPAVDRMALLLNPGGVRIHWITDGLFDRSGLDPLNESIEAENRRGSERLPLIESDWNKVRLEFAGEKLRVILNGQLVYERNLEPENRRTFGLFYFSDRTEAYVRHAVWRGDWPQELPSVEQQQLADHSLLWLDETRRQLPQSFRFDFREDLPQELFAVEGDQSSLQRPDNGLRLLRGGLDGALSLRACLQIGGDFDIVASFETFDYNLPVATDHVGIGLMTVLHNASQDTCAVYRHCERGNWDQLTSFTLDSIQNDGSTSIVREKLVEDAFAGRLRLARRGNVVYALFAEVDSTNYRLIGQQTVSPADVEAQGLRLVTQCGREQGLGVTLKELEIRADRLYGLPVTQSAPTVETLDVHRKELEKLEVKLGDRNAFEVSFQQQGTTPHDRTHSRSGTRLKSSSSGETETLRYQSRFASSSILDVDADLQINQLDKPPVIDRHCEVALKSFLRSRPQNSSDPIAARFIIRQPALGGQQLIAEVDIPRRGGVVDTVTIRSIPIASPDRLRLSIRQGRLYFLFSEQESDAVRVLAEYPVSADASISTCELESVATGTDRMTDVTWKSLVLYRRD